MAEDRQPTVPLGRRWRDVGLLAVLCAALTLPWLLGSESPPPAPPPSPVAALIAALRPQPPHDAIDAQAVAAAQRGLREVLDMRDSSAPPPVFDPARLRVEHRAGDLWVVTGVVSAAWQMMMASPHVYAVSVYRVCHVVDPACFKVRAVNLDSQVLLSGGGTATAPPP
jgi:hypothetical protein